MRFTELSQDDADGLSQGLPILIGEFAHLFDDDAFFDRGEDGFYNGRLDKTCRFSLIHGRFAEGGGWLDPAGYGHENEIGTVAMVRG